MSATMIGAHSRRIERTSEFQKEPPRLQGRILVADDSSDGRRIISNMLRCMGLDVALVDDGSEAFQMALETWHDGHPFDLVLMDTDMPGLDGYQATVMLRSAGYTGRIIALASSSFLGTQDRYLDAGCDGCASKPISYELLRETMERYLPRMKNHRTRMNSIRTS